ncbi:MarR family winged helix-turn-helix transcriptional regulator [Brevibacillus centrosporus]|jgi:DNA-binding MarR family transcriptional regulator|uniref:MarR family winged helix-turn-helix transcriptional regulator n=1 Tax=Brevibacillus centrosporus TaxID=54910 RepID=UPI000F0A62AE|nr:MarR family transcriptional regulator [Brevibacillus centrosporus]MEC2130692.1 MarR family transcriptional regulator [Brevibacillus centrosporus]MED1954572.1 MarR family transcriptional regulator [Brevibacillus centrosporus]RNB69268.1 MarR family transcriptional regulator [Brevibacillus centrosporus]
MDDKKRMAMRLTKLNKVYLDVIAQELAACGMTVPQMFVLGPVMQGRRTIGEISRMIDLSYSTVSGIVDRLERNGFVERTRDHQDRRMVWVELVGSVEAIQNRIPFMRGEYFPELFSSMEASEVERASESLALLTRHLEVRQQSFPKKGGSDAR